MATVEKRRELISSQSNFIEISPQWQIKLSFKENHEGYPVTYLICIHTIIAAGPNVGVPTGWIWGEILGPSTSEN